MKTMTCHCRSMILDQHSGKCMACPVLLQTSCWSLTTAGITHMSQMWLSYLSTLLAWVSMPLICLLLSPPLTWAGNRHQSVVGPKPKLGSRSGTCKEERQTSPAAAGAVDKSSIRLVNLHLWNIWIDNECSHNWSCSRFNNCGFQGQVHTRTGVCSVLT